MINVVIDKNIKRLVQYGIDNNLIPECERIYSTNMLLEVFGKEDYSDPDVEYNLTLDEILSNLLDAAVKLNIIEDSVVSLQDQGRLFLLFLKSMKNHQKKQLTSTTIFQQKQII